MLIGRVIDSIWCTRKDEGLTGMKLMKIKLLDKEIEEGRVIVAIDLIGAGIGEKVLVTQGSSARKFVGLENAPIDAIVVGIIDSELMRGDMNGN
ncbi:ethanolamine utilization protein EutN [Alkalibaculum sp. M08DMB]|uniref:Ethanolamine utilization protein EutN n=1 Tax=Alkalibaculum sporogenes TaxID=2655001 RepID=A0A6A7K7Z5_9FIRM|nr:EutN/CcmL family microcompartment protein [Alkalibaculum sporogenes]MPW25515.1 ethanolamine utilization protein EutN [Alkalibaculum sporogenes]